MIRLSAGRLCYASGTIHELTSVSKWFKISPIKIRRTMLCQDFNIYVNRTVVSRASSQL